MSFPIRSRLRRRAAASLSAVLACAAPAALAFADEALEEIVVTADFRERGLKSLPVSATVLDSDRIDASAVQHFEELIYAVPNLNWSGDGNRARYLQIRGVGELEQYEGAPNPSVGLLIDDIDFSGIGGIATLFDLERVEVLRGPQGTRYGANALAGLVYMTSAEADGEPEVIARVSAGSDDLLAGGLAVGGSAASLRYRASLHHHESNGFRRNAFLGRDDTNGRRETTLRAKLVWESSNGWFFRLAGLRVDLDDGYDAFALDNGLTTLSDRPGRDAQQSSGLSLRAEKSLGDALTLTSITSFAQSDIDFAFDADWGNALSWSPFVYDYVSETRRERRTLAQELRLAGGSADTVEWTAGIYALALDEDLATYNAGEYEDLVVYNFTDALDERFDSRFEAINLAAFGEIARGVGERGTITLGLRVERRGTDYRDSGGLTLDPAETMIGGELSFLQRFDPVTTGYLRAASGYKAGGFNLGIAPAGRREFDQERLFSVEAGLRRSFADGRLDVDGALFYNRRRDQQVRTSQQLNPNDPASFVFFTDNAARGRSYGAEATLRYRPSDARDFYLSAAWLDTEFERFDGPGGTLEGRAEAHAPTYSLAAGAEFRFARGFFLRADVMARDAFYFDVSHDRRSASFERANLRIGYRNERLSFTLWGTNVWNESYAVRGFFFGNEPPDFPATLYTRRGDPRQLGLTVDVEF